MSFEMLMHDPIGAIGGFAGLMVFFTAAFVAVFTSAYLAIAIPIGIVRGRMFAPGSKPGAARVFLVTNDADLAGELGRSLTGIDTSFARLTRFSRPDTFERFSRNRFSSGLR